MIKYCLAVRHDHFLYIIPKCIFEMEPVDLSPTMCEAEEPYDWCHFRMGVMLSQRQSAVTKSDSVNTGVLIVSRKTVSQFQ